MRALDLLPGYNCGRCGYPSCRAFAIALREGKRVEDCPLLVQDRYATNLEQLRKLVLENSPETFPGLVGGSTGDVLLGPLPGEPSCREDIYPFDRDVRSCTSAMSWM